MFPLQIPELSRAMKHTSIEWDYGRRRSPLERRQQELKALQTWLTSVGKKDVQTTNRRRTPLRIVDEQGDEDRLLQEAIARALAESLDDTTARSAVRSAHVNYAMQSRYVRLKRELSKRSAIFYALFSQTEAETRDADTSLRIKKRILFYVGMVFMWIGMIAFVLLVPCFLASTVLGVLFPVIQLLRGVITEGVSSITFVSIFLTIAYSCLILGLLLLIPFVGEFQLFRTDVVNLTGFPPIFYEVATVKEIHSRFVQEVDSRILDKNLDNWFGMDVALLIKSFVEPEETLFEEATLRAFQHRVQSVSV